MSGNKPKIAGAPKKARDEFQEDNIFQAPIITRDPMSRQARIGSRVVIRVNATGKPLPSYQWFHNGKKIVGANSDRLSLPKVRRQAIGAYHCEAKNFVGKAVSRAAMLSFFTAAVPKLVIGPEKTKLEEGKPFTLSVVSPKHTELKDFKVFWMFNGMRIKGAHGPTLNISAAKKKYEGEYKAMIATGSSIETSNVATLKIKAAKVAKAATAAPPEPEPEPIEAPEPEETKPAAPWDDFNFNPEDEMVETPAAEAEQFGGIAPRVPEGERSPLSELATKDLILELTEEGGATALIEEAQAQTKDHSALIETSPTRLEGPEHDDPSALLHLLATPEPEPEPEPVAAPAVAAVFMPPSPPAPKRANPALERKKAFLERMLQHWSRPASKRAA